MSDMVLLNVTEPVSASNVRTALKDAPGMDKLTHARCSGNEVRLFFSESLPGDQVATLQGYAPFLPLVARKLRAIKQASEDCEAAIVGGLQFDATGTTYWYDSDRDAQLNLVGAAVAQQPTYWHVRLTKFSDKQAVLHEHAQIVAVGRAVAAHKGARVHTFQVYATRIKAATSIAEVEQLVSEWDPHATEE